MENIKTDASKNAMMSLNLDNLRFRYRETDSVAGISVVFPAHNIQAFDLNLFQLLSQCETVVWNSKWSQKPDYVSYEYYGTTSFWAEVLFVNQIQSVEEFKDFTTIMVPSYESIIELSYNKIDKAIENLESDEAVNPNAIYYKKYPMDDAEIAKREADEALDTGLVGEDETEAETETSNANALLLQIEEEITLTQTMIDNNYISLDYQPSSPTSISVFLDGESEAFRYAYDYVLLENTTTEKWDVISWEDASCPYGIGLAGILNEVGLVINVTYVVGGGWTPPSELFDIDGGVYTGT